MKSKQAGFTLIEIAIVLVIIGLLLGGVLKGQELINNAKIKSVANDLKGVAAAYYSYQDRFRRIPGDDVAAVANLGATATAGDGDGVVENAYDSATADQESRLFWEHIRLAGFATGAGQVQPNNTYGGIVGVQSGAYGMTGIVACTNNVPSRIAQAVDNAIDDGVATTGTLRSGTAATTAVGDVLAYTVDDTARVICMTF